MKLGDDTNFLEVIPRPSGGFPGLYMIRARMSDSLSECSIRHDAITFDTSDATRAEFEKFAALASHTFVLRTARDGAITLNRDRRGAITVGYRIVSWEADAALEGSVRIDGEFSTGFLREFKILLEARPAS